MQTAANLQSQENRAKAAQANAESLERATYDPPHPTLAAGLKAAARAQEHLAHTSLQAAEQNRAALISSTRRLKAVEALSATEMLREKTRQRRKARRQWPRG
jgi:hypothetical protein